MTTSLRDAVTLADAFGRDVHQRQAAHGAAHVAAHAIAVAAHVAAAAVAIAVETIAADRTTGTLRRALRREGTPITNTLGAALRLYL